MIALHLSSLFKSYLFLGVYIDSLIALEVLLEMTKILPFFFVLNTLVLQLPRYFCFSRHSK